jgi:hypothetical protein
MSINMNITEDGKMKLGELINLLSYTMKQNGDMDVVGIVDGKIFKDIEINCPDKDSPMYIELYMED